MKRFIRLVLVLVLFSVVLLAHNPQRAEAQAAWAPGVFYNPGTLVTYSGVVYKCLQPHTSQVGWEPPNVAALWERQSGTVPTNTPGGATATRTPSGTGCTAPAWNSSSVYVAGDVVSYNGRQWHANWWVQGEAPSATGSGAWSDLGACSGATSTGAPPTATRTRTNTPVPGITPTRTNTPLPATATRANTPTGNNGSPYGGTPANIPGRLEAERFNIGGQGIAFSDNETANQGGQFRTTEGVDIEITTDAGAGYNVGWTVTGEWLKYTVNVQTSGTYSLNFRVASAQAGATFHLEVDGVNVTGTQTVPNTGGWQTWQTVVRTGVNLTAGQRVLRLFMVNGGGNFNWIDFTMGTSPTATRTNTPIGATATRTNTPPAATATRTRTPVPPTVPPASDKFLMAYYPSWGTLPVTSIPANKITHVLYAFSDLNASGQCAPASGNAATHMSQFKTLKQQYPHLKVLVSVGGWTLSDYFSANVTTATQRQNLVASCINLWIKGIGLAGAGAVDGIDIDWEFPGAPGETNNYSPADKANFVLMMQEFRNQLNAQGAADGKYYTLGAALNTSAANISAGYDLPGLAPILDFFMLMTYDFHGSWEPNGPTNFHSNLHPVTGDPAGNTLNINAAVNRFVSGGVPKSKIVVGVPFYGRGWNNVGSTNNGLFQPASGGIEVTYREIKASYETNAAYTKFRHSEARVVWLYSATNRVFLSYDDPQTAQEKASYVVTNGLKGAMFWEQSQDDSVFSLTQALCVNLGLAASGRC